MFIAIENETMWYVAITFIILYHIIVIEIDALVLTIDDNINTIFVASSNWRHPTTFAATALHIWNCSPDKRDLRRPNMIIRMGQTWINAVDLIKYPSHIASASVFIRLVKVLVSFNEQLASVLCLTLSVLP